jgi:hypothetical protein
MILEVASSSFRFSAPSRMAFQLRAGNEQTFSDERTGAAAPFSSLYFRCGSRSATISPIASDAVSPGLSMP